MSSLGRSLRLLGGALPLLALALIPGSTACVPDTGGGDAGPADASLDTRPVDTGPVRAIFALPRTGATTGFFDLPWPTDLRLTATGTPDLAGFPNPRSVDLLDSYFASIERSQVGYATNGAVYFRFSRSVDPASLPGDAEASRASGASVFLIDVDPDSPERGTRHPCVVDYEDRNTLFWPGQTVSIRPVHGFPMAPNRTYAAVVTRGVVPMAGGTFARDADFEALLGIGGDADVVAARALYQPAIDAVVAAGVALADINSLAVFTTEDPTEIGFAIRDWLRDETTPHVVPDAIASSWTAGTGARGVVEIDGRYGPVPVFQDGVIPYTTEGGAIALGADGAPVVVSTFEARFAITLPAGAPMPPGGFPLVLYSHGTGGDCRSFIQDGTAQQLAMEGYAVMGIDQIHHGDRNPTDLSPEILFFNLNNPDAVRFNTLESAIDIVQQARAAARFVIPDFISVEGGPVRFDPDHFYFFGHSQGGLVGPLFLGMDDSVRGGVVSAGGAIIAYALLEKEEPISIPGVVRSALSLGSGDPATAFMNEGFDFDHPVITLLQGWIEPSDPSNYGPYAIEHPRPGFAPKHILSTEGLRDVYVSPSSIEALALSMRVPLVEPVSRAVPGYALLDLPVMGPSVSLNVAGGLATAGLLQFPEDGHFAVFDNATAQARIRGFFASLHTDTPTIPAP